MHLGHPDNLQQFSINVVIKYWQVQTDEHKKLSKVCKRFLFPPTSLYPGSQNGLWDSVGISHAGGSFMVSRTTEQICIALTNSITAYK